MTDTRVPPGDERAQDRETVLMSSSGVARPEAAGPHMGSVGLDAELAVPQPDLELAYESGVEVKARSQWAYARTRFFRHKLAVVSLLILLLFGVIALFPGFFAPYGYDEIPFTDPVKIIENPNIVVESINQPPTLKEWHLFGTDQLGRDSLSRVIFGMRTSLWVALFVAIVSTAIGTTIGAIAGYYGGVIDNLLMRFTDLILVLPFLAVLLTLAAFFGTGDPTRVALILAFLFWTTIARIIRGVFLSLREKEYVEAANAAGASDLRIILRHMLPNTVGPIIVNATLVVAAAILTEAALSFLGFGIQPPHPALGALINDGQGEGTRLWWLVTFPGLTIVLIALAVNFVGDGLRDALDPTQRRIRA
jgi:ABC-type dipeptide/oligopeptide/nickel transport system permease subunit